jgi:hypothetical protein
VVTDPIRIRKFLMEKELQRNVSSFEGTSNVSMDAYYRALGMKLTLVEGVGG